MKRKIYLDLDLDYFVKPVFKSSINGVRLYEDEKCQTDDVGEFFKKLKSRMSIPYDKHIFTNHKKSYIYWWMKKLENCTVIHIDAHSDLYRNKQGDLRLISDREMNCDDYLWYAIRDNLISEIYWVYPFGVINPEDDGTLQKIINPSMVAGIEKNNGLTSISFKIINRMGQRKIIKLHLLNIDCLPDFHEVPIMLTMATSPEFIPSAADRLIDEVNEHICFDSDCVENIKKQHHKMMNINQDDIDEARMLLQI